MQIRLPPPKLPLLVEQLQTAPACLYSLIEIANDPHSYERFRDIVLQFLPKHSQDILTIRDSKSQVITFLDLFESEHFPLMEMSHDELQSLDEDDDYYPAWIVLTQSIPIKPHGFPTFILSRGWDPFNPGMSTLLHLFNLDNHHTAPDTLREQNQKSINLYLAGATLDKIPEGGYNPNDIAKAVNGTQYTSLTLFAQWLFATTGNPFLDHDDDFFSQHYFLDHPVPWTKGKVQQYTAFWQEARATKTTIEALVDWLEEDLPANLDTLLDTINQAIVPTATAASC